MTTLTEYLLVGVQIYDEDCYNQIISSDFFKELNIDKWKDEKLLRFGLDLEDLVSQFATRKRSYGRKSLREGNRVITKTITETRYKAPVYKGYNGIEHIIEPLYETVMIKFNGLYDDAIKTKRKELDKVKTITIDHYFFFFWTSVFWLFFFFDG